MTQPTIPADQLQALLKRQKKHKYGAQATTVDGIRFASKAEAGRWLILRMMQAHGVISGLKRQVRHKLLIETTYVSDFEYYDAGQLVVEDVKGYSTREYKRKAREMKRQLGIEVREIRNG